MNDINDYMRNHRGKNILPFLIVSIIVLFSAVIGNITFSTICALIELVFCLLIIKNKNNTLLTFSSIFLILSFILHMGNLVAVCVFNLNNSYIISLNKSLLLKSVLFFMICQLMFTMGSTWKDRYSIKQKMRNLVPINKRGLVSTGVCCFLVGIIPRMYIDLQQILFQSLSGYNESLEQLTQYGIISILAQFFYVGVCIILFCLDDHIIIARIFSIAIVAWEVITMLSGGRLYAISLICVVVYIYFLKIEKIKIRYLILGIVIIIAGSFLMNIIATIRTLGSFDISSIANAFKSENITSNPLLTFLAEMGSTMKTVVFTLQDIPKNAPYALGASYLDSILSVIPAYESNVADINHMIYIYNFTSFHYLGGSWIGEAYYNFSWLGCLVCFVIGRILGKFELQFCIDDEEENYFSTICILTFLFYLITYIRDYFYRFCTTIQVCLVVVVLAWLFSKVSIRRTK